jgi:hypothetical protein
MPMGIYSKLSKIQQTLIAPKNQYNSFGKYSYRSCEDIFEAIKPHLKEHKLSLTISDELVMVGERYYVKATATLIDCETDECVTNSAYAREDAAKTGMSESQVTGACSSFARKYCLNGLFCIDDVKDEDEREGVTAEPEPKKVAAKKEVDNTKYIEEITKKLKEDNLDVAKFCALYKIPDINGMTEKFYKHAISRWDTVKSKIS